MSHHTTVTNVTNVNIYIESVNAVRKASGLGPLPNGTSVSKATQSLTTLLRGQVKTEWAKHYADVPLGDQEDSGYMSPASALVPGEVPKCVEDQIKMDLRNWQLPLTTNTPQEIGSTITQELSSQGGVKGTAFGGVQVNSNETINWMVGYAKVNISGNVSGFIYVFAAALSF